MTNVSAKGIKNPYSEEDMTDFFGKTKTIVGFMGAGKTEKFVKEVNEFKYKIKNDRIVGSLCDLILAKPIIDVRYPDITSRDGYGLVSEKLVREGFSPISLIENIDQLRAIYEKSRAKAQWRLLGISEVQFLPYQIIDFLREIKERKDTYVVLEGLEDNFRGELFSLAGYEGTMGDIVKLSDELLVCDTGWCSSESCLKRGKFTQRQIPYSNPDGEIEYIPAHWASPLVVIGDEHGDQSKKPEDKYVARCATHHEVPGKDVATLVRQAINIAGDKGIDIERIEQLYCGFTRSGQFNAMYPRELDMILKALAEEKQMTIKHGAAYKTPYLRLA
jgi:thymidine kinase